MKSNGVAVQLDDGHETYLPGDELRASYRVMLDSARDVRAVEASVLWYTEGKGSEDVGVHYFERRAADEGHRFEVMTKQLLSTRLPASPLSYDGVIVKVRWCVRVRVFLAHHAELLGEAPFRLGQVAPVQGVVK